MTEQEFKDAAINAQWSSYTVIRVLDFLKGRPLDAVSAAYVSALRPSTVRFARGGVKLDASSWRVTIWLDEKNLIRFIEQEVAVGLTGGIRDGHDLEQKLQGEAF